MAILLSYVIILLKINSHVNYTNVGMRTTNLESKALQLMKDIVLTWSSQSRMDDNFLILKDLE